jgi:MraZ protein
MFIGQHQHSIDEKGRLQLPVKWRSKLADSGAVITKGFDGSLTVYPMAIWQGIAEKLAALPQSQREVRAYVRLILASAVDVELDNSGRVIIPQYLRQYAHLGKQTILAGLNDRIEVWDSQTWESYQQNIDQESTDFQETLTELGI